MYAFKGSKQVTIMYILISYLYPLNKCGFDKYLDTKYPDLFPTFYFLPIILIPLPQLEQVGLRIYMSL